MDIGKRYSWCEAIAVEDGRVLKEAKLPNHRDDFIRFALDLPKPIRLVMEATGNWQHLYECWEELAEEILMAHPLKTKAIASAKIKTDRIDDGILAHLGRADLVPQAYIPTREIRDLRDVLRHRAFLVSLQTKIKNRIHSYLEKLGIQGEGTDLFGVAGLSWLKAVELRTPYRTLMDQDLHVLEVIREEIKKATRMIDRLANEDPRAAWLLPIRGLGKYSVMLILSEIGTIDRFPTPKQLVSFAGLCPSTHQSGAVSYHGRITKQGSRWLRWILVEAAQHYPKAPGRLGDFYRRIARKKGGGTAKVALARELLTGIYYCLKKKVCFEEHPRKEKTPVCVG